MTYEYVRLTLKAIIRYLKYFRIPYAEGNRVIIAGNGPSLANDIQNHIDILQRETVFSVNHFVDSDAFSLIKPKYYCMLDPSFLLTNLSPERLANRNASFANLNNKTEWELHFFCPLLPGQIVLEDYLTAKDIHLHMCNIFPGTTWPIIRNYLYRTGAFMPPPQNVLVAAIFIALNMGYKEVYLIGAEHSWLQDVKISHENILCAVQNHFSGRSEHKPMYKAAPKNTETFKYHELLTALSKTFRSYWLLKEYATFRGATIYNATPDSYIDAFERKPITSIML